MESPLANLRIVELARILAGPWIGQTLADLGADVVKVESPEGDDTRRWGPPFISANSPTREAAYFHCCNRGKRSIVADFRIEQDLEMVLQLIDEADVLIENFKTGTLARYGLDYASLARRNPKLIYCSVTGFGQTGPYAERPGYDAMIQAMCGLMDLTGEPEGHPQKIGVALVDIMTGLYGTIGIQAALAQRERTGRGQHIDVALFDVGVAVLANQALNYLVSGRAPSRQGNAHPNIVPYQTFAVANRHVMIAVGSDAQFRRLCDVIGRADLAEDARYATNADRVRERKRLVAELASTLASWDGEQLLSRLESAGVPAGPVNTLTDVFNDPQVRHRELVRPLKAPRATEGTIPSLPTPIRFSAASLALTRAAPMLGEHTEEVRDELEDPSRKPTE